MMEKIWEICKFCVKLLNTLQKYVRIVGVAITTPPDVCLYFSCEGGNNSFESPNFWFLTYGSIYFQL